MRIPKYICASLMAVAGFQICAVAQGVIGPEKSRDYRTSSDWEKMGKVPVEQNYVSNDSQAEDIAHLSIAYPDDLLHDHDLSKERQSKKKTDLLKILNSETAIDMSSEKLNVLQRTPRVSERPFTAVTTDYGQLDAILNANEGSLIDSLIVVGPMDASDFDAIWNQAVYGHMLVIDLKDAVMKDNTIPHWALYDPIQFQTAFWLRVKRIILPEGIVKIEKAAFPFMGLEEINIPSTVREIGSTCFGYDRWLNCEIVIPEGVELIDYQTFIDCFRLVKAPVLPSTLKGIGSHAFGNTSFAEIELPDGLEFIKEGAFQGTLLESVTIPESCLTLGEMAFQINNYLTEVHLPSQLQCIPYGLFSYCEWLEYVKLPEECRIVDQYAFVACRLKDIDLNDKLEIIGSYGFSGGYLEELHIPKSVKKLDRDCFHIIDNMKDIYCESEIPPTCVMYEDKPNAGPFSYRTNYDTIVLHVPVGSKDLYKTARGWDLFLNIVEDEGLGVTDIHISDPMSDNVIYDLNGVPVRTLSPNKIYIKDGKKAVFH